jgi:recombination protein RecR
MSDENKELENYLSSLPGIGPRQARRIVYYLLRKEPRFSRRLGELLSQVRQNTRLCQRTFHYFYTDDPAEKLSPIARDPNRDHSKILIVETDPDLENIESMNIWNGSYFVLGGNLRPSTNQQKFESFIRLADLSRTLGTEHNNQNINEVVIGLSSTVNGDFTTDIVTDYITGNYPDVIISRLARGLSTGSSLEYVDKNTLQQALEHRS